jgi:hypothetical protein
MSLEFIYIVIIVKTTVRRTINPLQTNVIIHMTFYSLTTKQFNLIVVELH